MNFEDWYPFYKKIITDLSINQYDDEIASNNFNELLNNVSNLKKLDYLKQFIADENVVICGAGPSLVNSIVKYNDLLNKSIIITADGATSALLKYDVLPDIIVTDLDGEIDDQIKSNEKGSKIIIHAHSDNIDLITKYLAKFPRNILGTIQTNPAGLVNVENVGGFTDGDRAVFLCNHFNASKINLIGFDYDEMIGFYSFANNKNIENKLKKLKWCKYLIEILLNSNDNILYLK